ncbi:unnamed protein product [Boreogadus saida]
MTTTELHTPGPGEPLPGAEAAEGEARLRSPLRGRRSQAGPGPPLGVFSSTHNLEVSEGGGPGSERCGLEGRGSGGKSGRIGAEVKPVSDAVKERAHPAGQGVRQDGDRGSGPVTHKHIKTGQKYTESDMHGHALSLATPPPRSHVYSPASGGGGVGGRGSNGQTGISQTHRLPPGHGKAGT